MLGIRDSNQKIVGNGLVLSLDAAQLRSYPGSGTTWTDLSGNGNNGTLTNGPTYNTGSGGSIVFDGTNDNVVLGDVLDLGTNSLTINAWVQLATSPNAVNYIYSKAFFGAQNYRFGLSLIPNKLTAFMQGNGGADIAPTGTMSLSSNVWYMCTAVWDRASSVSMFINGVTESMTGTATISQWNGLNFQSINPTRVGSYTFNNNITPNLLFKGNIAMVQVYFKALSASEVLQNFNATRARFGI